MQKSIFSILFLLIVFSSKSLLASSLLSECFVGSVKKVNSYAMRKKPGHFSGRSSVEKKKTPLTKRFYGTSTSREKEEREKLMKKFQIVGIGEKNLKFDPKTSMYYYDEDFIDSSVSEPEKKVHDTFVEFSVVKKSK